MNRLLNLGVSMYYGSPILYMVGILFTGVGLYELPLYSGLTKLLVATCLFGVCYRYRVKQS